MSVGTNAAERVSRKHVGGEGPQEDCWQVPEEDQVLPRGDWEVAGRLRQHRGNLADSEADM